VVATAPVSAVRAKVAAAAAAVDGMQYHLAVGLAYSNHADLAAIAINDLLLQRTLWKVENHHYRDLSQTHAEPSSQKQCLSLGYH
jgi:hypothetical protein